MHAMHAMQLELVGSSVGSACSWLQRHCRIDAPTMVTPPRGMACSYAHQEGGIESSLHTGGVGGGLLCDTDAMSGIVVVGS